MEVLLDRWVHIEKPAGTKDGTFGAATSDFVPHRSEWANRRDARPGRQEQVEQGLEQRTKQVVYTMRWSDDLNAGMRIRDGAEVYQLLGDPAEVGGRCQWIEMLAEKYASTGGAGAVT